MEGLVLAVVLAAVIGGALMLESLLPHLPALLGIEGSASGKGTRPGHRGAGERERNAVLDDAVVDLERRLEAVERERDFYRDLALPAAGAHPDRTLPGAKGDGP